LKAVVWVPVIVVLFLAACGGSSEPEVTPTIRPLDAARTTSAGKTADAPNPTRTPAVRAANTSTPGPTASPTPTKPQQVEIVFTAITNLEAFADTVSFYLGRIAMGGETGTSAINALYTFCNEPGDDGRSAFGYSRYAFSDLWEKPFLDLEASSFGTCITLFTLKKSEPMEDSAVWRTWASNGKAELARAETRLPDYSEAQLKRAIEDRQ